MLLHVFEQAYQDSYLPFLHVFEPFSTLKISLHTSGSLIEWLEANHPEYLDRLAERSRATFWLNPEPRRYWDTGDSVMSRYSVLCDRVEQVRTLRQLEEFVEQAALPRTRRTRLAS